MNISSAGFMEMKVIETPASAPSSAALGVILRTMGARNPPAISTKLWMKTHVRPACQPLIGSPVASLTGSMMTKRDDEHVRHADARGERADVVTARLLRQAIGEPRVIHRAHDTS